MSPGYALPWPRTFVVLVSTGHVMEPRSNGGVPSSSFDLRWVERRADGKSS